VKVVIDRAERPNERHEERVDEDEILQSLKGPDRPDDQTHDDDAEKLIGHDLAVA
jgi:hypothetical protein